MARALMVQGTASGVGKSWITAGLCRILARRGLRVAPFKAQNMSNNAAVARMDPDGWGEIGRAQALQAEACGRAPHVDMNPLLIKPTGGRGVQVVVSGRAVGILTASEYQARRAEWWAAVEGAWARLSSAVDWVIVEGAGSPAEVNLRGGDLVNMTMAHHADARVLLVGDIERGGVFGSLYGTVALLEPRDRARLAGLVVNRFWGDPSGFADGVAPLEQLCGVPVRGVIPMRPDILLDEEDGQDLRSTTGVVDVCVLRLPTVSNFTDLGPLARAPGVGVRWAARPEEVGNPDLLVLPGSKDTLSDLAWLHAQRLDVAVKAAVARAIPVLGLCGGYQILGVSLEEGGVRRAGLGCLPVHTVMRAEKRVTPARGVTCGGWLWPEGLQVEGYEIHHGETTASDAPFVHLGAPDGAVVGLVAGTYLHGLLDAPGVAVALIQALRARKGLPPVEMEEAHARRAAMLDALADHLDTHLDLAWM